MSTQYKARLDALRQRMADTGTDLVAVGPSSHLVWLAGLNPHGDERPVLMIVSKDFAGMLMPALNADSQRVQTDLPFFTWADADGPDDALAELLIHAGATGPNLSVALDETMRADFALLLLGALKDPRHKFTDDSLAYLRAMKDEDEYAKIKRNALLNDGAMQAAYASLKPGITELEVAQVVRDYFKANGAEHGFASICFGANGAFPHHHTGHTKLVGNEAVLLDMGGRSEGFPSDMTRMAFMGQPDAEYEKVWAVVEAAVVAAIAAAKPGVQAKTVDKAARDVITAAGYGPNFLHRTGHGLGIDGHEAPYITASSETILQEGHVFSIEPGIYLAGKFGLRLEEIVILRKDGAEVFSELSRKTHIVS